MNMPTHAVYTSHEQCWRCGAPMLELDPPIEGWQFYCARCRHLARTQADLAQALQEELDETCGVPAARLKCLDIQFSN